MAGFRIEGNTSGNVAEVDSSNNLAVNLPTTNTLAGFQRLTAKAGTSEYRDLEISDEGQAYVAQAYQLIEFSFNGSNTNWSPKIGTNATTMTKAATNGFMRLNASSLTTSANGISIYSNRTVNLEEAAELRFKVNVKHNNATATNKQAEIGLGYYTFAAGQANAMNEFIGFRWTTGGGLLGVASTSFGGAPTEQTVSINGGVPYSDNVAREYKMVITDPQVLFYVDGAYVGVINKDPAAWGMLKGVSAPFIARIFNSGTASAAMTMDIGEAAIVRVGLSDNSPFSQVKSGMDNSTYYFQSDLQTTSTSPHNFPASGTAPTAAAGSNTASAANNTAILGGIIRNSLTAITTVVSTNIMWTAYQNPAYPTASGQATNARNLTITGLTIGPQVVTTALTGGPIVAAWFAAIGNTNISLATTDADGTTAVAQKAPRFVPLSLVSTISGAATVGQVSNDVGDHRWTFPTPLVVHPGEFFSVGFRTLAVTTNVTQGSADCMIGVNGFWD